MIQVSVLRLHCLFFTGLPMLGVIGDLALVLSRGETLEELCDRHYYAIVYVRSTHILTCDIEDFSTRGVGTMVLCILGSMGSHKISGGHL